MNRTLQIALLLTANASKASQAIDRFVSSSEKKMAALKKSASSWNEAGNKNLMQGAIIAAPIVAATKAAADLEDKIADVAKVANVDFGSTEFKKLELAAIGISNQFGKSATEVGELMAELAAGGVAKEQLAAVASGAAKIGLAFDVTGGEAGKAYMMIQNAMALTEKETLKVMDAMNAATNKFGGKAAELLNFMAQGGAGVAQTLKVSGTDMQAFANSMQVVGISSAEAATTMQRFQKAVLTNADAAAIFNKAGGGTQGIVAILEQAKKSGNAAQWLLSKGFGEYSTKIAQMANNMDTGKGVKAQLSYLGNDQNVKGSVDAEAANRMKTFSTQFKILSQQAKNAGVQMGQALMPVLADLMKQVKPIVERLSKWIQENPQLTQQIMKGVVAFAAFKFALGGVQKGIAQGISAFAGVTKAISGISKAFSVVSKLFMANPWMLAIMAIATAAFLIYKNWDKIKAFFIKLWDNVKKVFNAAWKWIKNMFLNYTPHGLVIKHWDKISAWFSSLWDGVKNIFSRTWEGIKNIFLNYTPHGLVIKHWDKIRTFFAGLWDGVKKGFMKFVDFFVSKWNWLNNTILKPMGAVFGGTATAGTIGVSNARTAPVPVPVSRAGGAAGGAITFNPVINMNGNASPTDLNMMTAQIRRDFRKQMDDYTHQQKRTQMS